MKKNILLVLAVMILVRCGYLDDYSQDMVVVKSVSVWMRYYLEVYIYPARKKYKI